MSGSQPCRHYACHVRFKERLEPLIEWPEVLPVCLALFRRQTADIGAWPEFDEQPTCQTDMLRQWPHPHIPTRRFWLGRDAQSEVGLPKAQTF
jgi:hypothetical protein